ncbi:hypothetical protein E2C01_005894 [Portunus trituberculatus]|uniref:Uncharacterized protein n=1 Tax=Portunus trituberculatus TaxID=210409 RepID=A0A5B7CTV6_PORTR|nr:hypothetical protein [Portunus trituberculatus]
MVNSSFSPSACLPPPLSLWLDYRDGARGRKDRSKEVHLRPGQYGLQTAEESVRPWGVTSQDMLAKRLKVAKMNYNMYNVVPCRRVLTLNLPGSNG